MTARTAREWHTVTARSDGISAGSFRTFTLRSDAVGLIYRDNSRQIWLGWKDLSAADSGVKWQKIGESFTMGPIVQTVGSEAIVVAGDQAGALSFTEIGEPHVAPENFTWQNLNLTSAQDPIAISWGAGRVDLFGLGEDSVVRQTWLERLREGWIAKRASVPVAEGVTEMPTAASWGPLRVDLFGRSAERSVTHKWWDDAADRLDIFTVENTSTTTHKYWHPGTGWLPAPPTQWEELGGSLTSPPAVVTSGKYHVDIFGRGSEGHLRHMWWSPENGWEPNAEEWEDMHGVLGGGPVAFAWGPDRLGLFAVSIENTLIYKYRDPGILWRPSLTRWYETSFPGQGKPAPGSLRVTLTPDGLAVVSVVEEGANRAHIGLFRP